MTLIHTGMNVFTWRDLEQFAHATLKPVSFHKQQMPQWILMNSLNHASKQGRQEAWSLCVPLAAEADSGICAMLKWHSVLGKWERWEEWSSSALLLVSSCPNSWCLRVKTGLLRALCQGSFVTNNPLPWPCVPTTGLNLFIFGNSCPTCFKNCWGEKI